MAVVDIGRGQSISIPTLRLHNGELFEGIVKISDSETMIVVLNPKLTGIIPESIGTKYVLAWENDGIQRSCPFLVRSHTAREMVGQLIIQERREAPRLHIDMDLRYEVVPPAEVKEVADFVMSRVNTAEEPASESLQLLRTGDDPLEMMRQEIQSLRELIQEMSGKIEDLAAAVRGEASMSPARGMMRPVSVVDCSSLGVGFIVSNPMATGDFLRIEMKLHATPAIRIECMGSIVRCLRMARPQEGPEHYDVGVRFTHIHESDRERLIHHLFKVQRRLLRDRKEALEMQTGTNS